MFYFILLNILIITVLAFLSENSSVLITCGLLLLFYLTLSCLLTSIILLLNVYYSMLKMAQDYAVFVQKISFQIFFFQADSI